MAQNQSIQNRPLPPQMERTIRTCLRAVGGLALAVCVIFWLSLLLR